MSDFTHLHVASAFSAHFGVTRPEMLAEAAAAQKMTALAITDRDGLYGAIKHIGACLKLGISPIVGVELSIVDDDLTEIARAVVLARGHDRGVGWSTLCSIVSTAHGYNVDEVLSDKPKRLNQVRKSAVVSIRRGELAKLIAENLGACTVLLGNNSDVGRSVLSGSREQAVALLTPWQELFAIPNSLAIEISTLLTEPETESSILQANRMMQLADSVGLPAVLTNTVRYLNPDDALTADVLDAARFLEPLGFFRVQPNAQAWLKPAALMHSLAEEICQDQSRASALLTETAKFADRFRLDPPNDCAWGKPKTPEKSSLGIDGNPFEVLWQKTEAGLHWRYPGASETTLAKVRKRLNQELITINKLEFATYFLTVADVAQMIRDMNVRIAARGSGAGSLVNYLLGISGVDPIEHDLLFERFLSTERSSLPDIDIDVESARRHDIYRNIFRRYGSNRVTLLSMQSTYRGRGAVRDSGLALGIEDDEIDQIAKSVWRLSAGSFRNAVGAKPELGAIAEALESDRKMNLLVDITERLNRLPRHISMHPCGVILGDSNLLRLTSIEQSGMGLPMSQFDKDDMDPMGMLKLDVLGVRMQSAMAYAVREIARVRGEQLDLDAIDRADEETFKSIRSTNTLGIFQIESPGQRELTGKHQPTEFNDLTIQISLFRPGPMKGNMIAPYLDGRHGFANPDFIHKDLEPILRESFGVVIFHEHVLRILNVMTGCSLAKADELRRSLEDPRAKPRIETFFRQTAKERGYPSAVIERVWQILEGFSSFGFCKAHGAAFALPTYQSAWLKTHYPVEFMAGLFTHDPGMYPKRLLMAEARRLGVRVLPIDVNKSSNEYLVEKTPDGLAVRLAIHEIAGISEAEVARIISGRPYSDIGDFYMRAKPSRRTFERIAQVGGLDELRLGDFGPMHTRGDVLARVRQLNASKNRKYLDPNQPTFDFDFKDLPTGLAEPSNAEKVEAELQILNLDFTEHALEQYRPMLDEMGVMRSDELVGLRSKTDVLVAGIRVATQTPPMRSGKRVVFVSLDDGTGCSDSTFFDEAQKRCSHILFNTKLLLISGKTRRTGVRGVSIMAENAWDLRELYNQWLQKRQAG
jgi:error-prone DNA polymerase